MKKKLDKKSIFEIWKVDSLRYTLALPLYLIFLVLLWHWNYQVIFWIAFVLLVLEYVSVTFKMNKTKINLFQ